MLEIANILIVEDEEEPLRKLVEIFNKRVRNDPMSVNYNYDVQFAKSFEPAKEKIIKASAEKKPFDALVLDLWIPERDGESYVRDKGLHLLEMEELMRHSPCIIITTCHESTESKIKAINNQVYKYLSKEKNGDLGRDIEEHIRDHMTRGLERRAVLRECNNLLEITALKSHSAILEMVVAEISHSIGPFIQKLDFELHDISSKSFLIDGPVKQEISERTDSCREIVAQIGERLQRMRPLADSETNFESVSVTDCVSSVLQMLQATLINEGINVYTIGINEVPMVQGQPEALKIALSHALQNARECMNGSFRAIEIACHVDQRRENVIIDISDTGKPLDSKEQIEVFDRSYTTKGTGHGLGLKISRQFLKAFFDGDISFQKPSSKLSNLMTKTLRISIPLPLQIKNQASKILGDRR